MSNRHRRRLSAEVIPIALPLFHRHTRFVAVEEWVKNRETPLGMDDTRHEIGFALHAASQHHPSSRDDLVYSEAARKVLIVGGSTRAAAWSAVRAGLQPICADLFADLDTKQIAEIVPVRSYPNSLPEDVAHVHAAGWFFTGALENRPDLVERMNRSDAAYGPLWGAPPSALRLVRDPFWVCETLRAAGLPVLDVLPDTSPPIADGTWLQKPFASAGGRAIRVWDRATASRGFHEPYYFQRRVAGEPMSAIFRTVNDDVEWLGATRQFINLACSRASIPFAYCGSFGPIELPSPIRETMCRIASALRLRSGLRGLFGIDFLLCHDQAWMTELNPRYTASVEVLELARQRALISLPSESSSPHVSLADKRPPGFVGKAILYATQSQAAPDLTRFMHEASPWQTPSLADVPVPGSTIESGWPICTVMAHGNSEQQCHDDLHRRIRTIVDGFLDHRTSG